jgi:predicted TPR repeat methyltransferase
MGNSSYQGKEWTSAFVQIASSDRPIKRILDIGPGQGTYYHLLGHCLPDSVWHGVEIFQAYIDKFNLNNFYDEIYNQDIRDFHTEESYDLVIAGDVLEHMEKEEAQAVVGGLLKQCRWFIISIPIVKWEQGAINDNDHEIHVKDDWSHNEVMDSFDNISYAFVGSEIGVYALRGYAQ